MFFLTITVLNSSDKEYRFLLPLITESFERGEKAFPAVSTKLRDQRVGRDQRRLETVGTIVDEADNSQNCQ